MRATDSGRAALWLPLLRELTAATADWTVWKNVDSALFGTGDVDSAAPKEVWPTIEHTFHDWAGQEALGPTVACLHIPRTANYFALLTPGPALLQLEVKAGATFRGSVQFHARDVLALSVEDERGFRRLRAGAEGVLKLLNNGMRRGGRADPEGLRAKDVIELLRADPGGVAAMAVRFGPARSALLAGVDAVLQGGWDRRAMLAVEGWAAAKALVQPHVVTERVWFRAVRKPTCPVLRVVYRQGRQAPRDVTGWLRDAARTHTVTGLT